MNRLIYTRRVEYLQVIPSVNINYQSIGSGGVKQFTERTVDSGATDAPLTENETCSCMSSGAHPWNDRLRCGCLQHWWNTRERTKTDRPCASWHLPWQDSKMGWSKDQGSESQPGYFCRAQVWRIRHHLHLDKLPLTCKPWIESDSRRRQVCTMTCWTWCTWQRRRLQHGNKYAQFDRLCWACICSDDWYDLLFRK